MSFSHDAQAIDLPAPPGWQLQWGDNFAGPAGSLPSAANWRIDTGHGYPNGPVNWGTSEIENFAADPANLRVDGQGHLLITPQRDASGQWTSGRIETVRDNFNAPEGGALRMEARIQMPDVTGPRALGYWPAFWGAGKQLPHDLGMAQGRRVRHHGERQRPGCGLGHFALRHESRWPLR
ncbi:hypothetical protein [Dyella choica]|uniref:hypothetical protein n=1 Tax=Dyella choica TaxID=1927959 RepID=UPI001E6003F7|nr:hypothetical protein [Dyella choica]